MERKRTNTPPISNQLKARLVKKSSKEIQEYDGDFGTVINTGSTLLDLAVSGDRIHGGGIPSGILVEAFGPSSSGKTVLLSEMAGDVQRKGGEVRFEDPESRLNTSFARMFGLEIEEENYDTPDTVTEVFHNIRKWKPPKKEGIVHGIFIDSLAALSTKMEMENEEGDKMGGRRAKEFSEELRKTCRMIKKENYLMVCSNQIRENMDAVNKYSSKDVTPGGKAVGFYSSLRLQFGTPTKIKSVKNIAGKERERIIGVETKITVFKSSISKPYRVAPVTILFDYGIDDIRQNLQFIKDYTGAKIYTIDGHNLDKSMDASIKMIESSNLEKRLKEEVINLWEEVEHKFETDRKLKIR